MMYKVKISSDCESWHDLTYFDLEFYSYNASVFRSFDPSFISTEGSEIFTMLDNEGDDLPFRQYGPFATYMNGKEKYHYRC